MLLHTENRIPQHRKRKRRRSDCPPKTGKPILDEHVKGDIGYFSEDLLADLNPSYAPHGQYEFHMLLTQS